MRKPLLFAIALVTAAAHSPLSSQEGIELDASGAELRLRGPAPQIRFFKEAGPVFPATSHSISGAVDLDGNSILSLYVNEVLVSRGSTLGSYRVLARGILELASTSRRMRFIGDEDGNEDAQVLFSWHEDDSSAGARLMQLNASNGGDLLIGGQLFPGTNFDLAEAFWAGEPLSAGDVVRVDPARGDAVLKARQGYERTMLGVVSERPAILLGGSALSPEALRRAWGDAIAELFEHLRPELEARVLERSEGLRAEASRLSSPGSFAAYSEARATEPPVVSTGGPEEEADPDPQRLAAAYEKALADHQSELLDEAMRLLFAERFAPVALSGRVAVRADASFGAIRAGDFLTSSPVPGVAMRATAPGPTLGMALEALSEGAGRVLVLVNRGWYGGEGRTLAAELAEKDREIEQLNRRLMALEARLEPDALIRDQLVAAPTSGR